MMLDIDRFKAVNDTYGHAAGDAALRQLVSICTATLRKTDVLVRVGGEEFAILAPASDAEEAMHLAERLRHKITAATVFSGDVTFGFTVSIGLTPAVLPGEAIGDVLARADIALYEAKRTGQNRVVKREAPFGAEIR